LQFSPYLTAPADPASPIARIQDHVMANIGGRHTLQSLATEAGMRARNLSRHIVQETGIMPHEFVECARIDAARRLLDISDRPVKVLRMTVASVRRTGCGSSSAGPSCDTRSIRASLRQSESDQRCSGRLVDASQNGRLGSIRRASDGISTRPHEIAGGSATASSCPRLREPFGTLLPKRKEK
jgi:AraC-like DNA-binding protein